MPLAMRKIMTKIIFNGSSPQPGSSKSQHTTVLVIPSGCTIAELKKNIMLRSGLTKTIAQNSAFLHFRVEYGDSSTDNKKTISGIDLSFTDDDVVEQIIGPHLTENSLLVVQLAAPAMNENVPVPVSQSPAPSSCKRKEAHSGNEPEESSVKKKKKRKRKKKTKKESAHTDKTENTQAEPYIAANKLKSSSKSASAIEKAKKKSARPEPKNGSPAVRSSTKKAKQTPPPQQIKSNTKSGDNVSYSNSIEQKAEQISSSSKLDNSNNIRKARASILDKCKNRGIFLKVESSIEELNEAIKTNETKVKTGAYDQLSKQELIAICSKADIGTSGSVGKILERIRKQPEKLILVDFPPFRAEKKGQPADIPHEKRVSESSTIVDSPISVFNKNKEIKEPRKGIDNGLSENSGKRRRVGHDSAETMPPKDSSVVLAKAAEIKEDSAAPPAEKSRSGGALFTSSLCLENMKMSELRKICDANGWKKPPSKTAICKIIREKQQEEATAKKHTEDHSRDVRPADVTNEQTRAAVNSEQLQNSPMPRSMIPASESDSVSSEEAPKTPSAASEISSEPSSSAGITTSMKVQRSNETQNAVSLKTAEKPVSNAVSTREEGAPVSQKAPSETKTTEIDSLTSKCRSLGISSRGSDLDKTRLIEQHYNNLESGSFEKMSKGELKKLGHKLGLGYFRDNRELIKCIRKGLRNKSFVLPRENKVKYLKSQVMPDDSLPTKAAGSKVHESQNVKARKNLGEDKKPLDPIPVDAIDHPKDAPKQRPEEKFSQGKKSSTSSEINEAQRDKLAPESQSSSSSSSGSSSSSDSEPSSSSDSESEKKNTARESQIIATPQSNRTKQATITALASGSRHTMQVGHDARAKRSYSSDSDSDSSDDDPPLDDMEQDAPTSQKVAKKPITHKPALQAEKDINATFTQALSPCPSPRSNSPRRSFNITPVSSSVDSSKVGKRPRRRRRSQANLRSGLMVNQLVTATK
eukprot:UC4_evm3s611